MEILQGRKAKYIIESQTGEHGKFGGICIGTVEGTGQKVSIKILKRYSWQLPEVLSRLQQIDYKHIAKVLEFFVKDRCLYIVREYVEGFDLKSVLDDSRLRRKVGWKNFVVAGISLLNGLEVIHNAGILHRDIKPSNVVVRFSGNGKREDADFNDIVLIDFEQASLYPDVSEEKAPFAMLYSPPEMLMGFNSLVCPSSDLFSVGIMLFQLISGESPYPESNPEYIMNLQLTYPIKKTLWMKDRIFQVISRATHKQAFRVSPSRMSNAEKEKYLSMGIDGRYQTAGEMREEMQSCL